MTNYLKIIDLLILHPNIDVTLADFKQIINKYLIQLESKCLNDIKLFFQGL